MNVSVAQTAVDIGNGRTMKKNVLIVNKNFKAGEEIYEVKDQCIFLLFS